MYLDIYIFLDINIGDKGVSTIERLGKTDWVR